MDSRTSTSQAPRRYDCVGLTYYSAWMRSNGSPPVCVGFSSVKEEEAAADAQTQHTSQESGSTDSANFKFFCLGYSSCSSNQSGMPHCEGIEIIVEMPASSDTDLSTTRGAGLTDAAQSCTSQAAPASASEQQPAQAIHTHLMSKAAQNVGLMQAALRNEGPVVFKPWPKDQEELQTRVMEAAQRNGRRMYSGAVRVANSAYAATVKPLAAILGLTPRPKS